MEYRTEFVYFTSCVFLVIISDKKGYAQQRQAAEGPVMAAQIGYGGYNSNMSWEELQKNERMRKQNEEIARENRRREQERQEQIRENERRQQQNAQEERQRERERQRKQQGEWNRQNERNRLMSEGETVRCWAKGGKNYDCRGGLKCCKFFGCCNGFQEFLSYWYIWWLPLVMIIACCVVCLRYKKPTTITTVPTTVSPATTTCMNNTCTTSNAGIATTVHSTTTYNGNGFEVHVDDPATYLLSSTSPSRHQSGDSNRRSRHQSGRNTPSNSAYQSGCNTPNSTYQDIPSGGTGSGAPPSYFDAVYKGVGQRTGTPTMNEHQSSDAYHDASAPIE